MTKSSPLPYARSGQQQEEEKQRALRKAALLSQAIRQAREEEMPRP